MDEVKLPKNVYKVKERDKWVVKKSINGKTKYFKSFDNPYDAIKYKEYMDDVGWSDADELKQIEYERLQKQYFIRISLDSTRRLYRVKHYKYGDLDRVDDLCKALFYRDLYSTSSLPRSEIPLMCDCDLVSDNPYLKNGLEFEVPERLFKTRKVSRRGKGKIVKKSRSSYSIYYGREHYCSCRTYEQAYYVRRELVKVEWDKSKLDGIFDKYPVFYTRLLHFYIYITKDTHNPKYWLLTIPKDKSDDGKLQHVRYSRLEDALFERDFLMEHEWDYELLVEIIDDNKNPYYDMELPPYPERKIRNISPRKSHDKEFLQLADLIRENPRVTMDVLAGSVGIVPATLRNWFKQYNTNSQEFYKVCREGKNPLDYFEQEELIYTPDLSKSVHSNHKGYVHYRGDRKNKFIVSRNDKYYGSYPTRELANKVVKELDKVGWDKSYLDEIKRKFNYNPRYTNDMIYIYDSHGNGKSWQIRKKINGRTKNFGVYHDIRLVKLVRDILISRNFECSDLDKLRSFSIFVFNSMNSFYGNMFGGVCL